MIPHRYLGGNIMAELPANHFKRGLAAGRPQIGLWLSLTSPVATEIVAGAGFDWVLIDMEHSANDLPRGRRPSARGGGRHGRTHRAAPLE